MTTGIDVVELAVDVHEVAEARGGMSPSWNRRADRTMYPQAYIEAKQQLAALSEFIMSLDWSETAVPDKIFHIIAKQVEELHVSNKKDDRLR